MRLTGSRAYTRSTPPPKMPAGLVELMEGLTKDVLKNNPDNLYEFCAGHMQKLIDIRDGNLPKKQKISLEDKIKIAQEKVRRRIYDRLMQYDDVSKFSDEKNSETNISSGTQEKSNMVAPTTDPKAASSEDPVNPDHHEAISKVIEVETVHDPNVTVATTDIVQEPLIEPDETVRTTDIEYANTENDAVKEAKESYGYVKDDSLIKSDDFHLEEIITENHTDLKDRNYETNDVSVTAEILHGEYLIDVKPISSETPVENSADKKKDTTTVQSKPLPEHVAPDSSSDDKFTNNNENISLKTPIQRVASSKKDSLEKHNELDDDTTNESKDANKALSTQAQLAEIVKNLTEVNGAINQTVHEALNTETVISPKPAQIDNEKGHDIEKEEHMNEDQLKGQNSTNVESETSNDNNEDCRKANEDEEKYGDESQDGTRLESKSIESDPSSNIGHSGKSSNHAASDQDLKENEHLNSKKVENETGAEGIASLEHLESAASFENDQNKNILPVVEGDVMKKIENATNAETSENLEHLKSAASFESTQDNNELPVFECLVLKKVGYETVALENSEHLESAASLENDKNNDKYPLVEENVTKNVENATTTKNSEHLKNATSFENGHNENELPVEGNVIDTAREFLEQERHFSSELVTEVLNVVSEKSTLENDTTGESDATIEPNSGMDLETAAVTIQKVFRNFLFSKSRTSTLDDSVNENSLDEDMDKKGETEFISSANLNKERRALGISRMDTVLQTVNEEKSLSLSTDDSSLSSAATTIQAHVRGFLLRNRLASYKTTSNSSLVNSEGPSTVSLDGESKEPKKTILNIHIVPERGQFMSRDESILTSIDLPLDNSPPSSVNLHPLGYDKSEPRKQLKREDAIQSVSPPSNNSGKVSEEVDSVKENENNIDSMKENKYNIDSKLESVNTATPSNATDQRQEDAESCDTTLTISSTADTVVDAEIYNPREAISSPEHNTDEDLKHKETVANLNSDEMDVVTPFPSTEKTTSLPDTESNEKPKLIHTGEFHDMVVQTQVKRSASSVVREFKNVLVYFLIWDKT